MEEEKRSRERTIKNTQFKLSFFKLIIVIFFFSMNVDT